MDRRDALKSLTALAGATSLTVVPVTTHDVHGVELVLLKVKGLMSSESMQRLQATWQDGVRGTALEQTRTIVLDAQIEAEFVRTT